MRRFLLLIVSGFLLASCGVNKRLSADSRDSVVVIIKDSVILRDSVVLVPIPAEITQARLPDCDTSHLETSAASSDAWVSSGELHHTLRNKSGKPLPISITLPTHVRQESNYHGITKTIIKPVERDLTGWQKFLMLMGKIASFAVILTAIVFILKILR